MWNSATMITIQEFTDPACPWAFSAEPTRYRLRWLYGDALRITRPMIVLTESGDEYLARGFDTPQLAAAFAQIQHQYGMPITAEQVARMPGTIVACRAVVAARVHASEHETALLRRLRIRWMAGQQIDDASTVADAATDVGLDPEQLEVWMADPAVESALRDDMERARTPSPAARAMDHKLATASDGRRRYTAPSWEMSGPDGRRLDIAGFNPTIVYEQAVANLVPGLPRREDPATVTEVLTWAGEPLATAEVAEVMGRGIPSTREQLEATGARFTPVATDGYWSLSGG